MSIERQRQILDDLNYAQDSRNCKRDEAPVLYLPDGTEKPLPTTWVVCDVCEGKGSHVNPSIDAGGLSAEDFDADPDFADDYFGGTYDQTCNKCGGRTTVRAVNLEALTDDERELYQQQQREEAQDRACYLAELRAGA